MPIVHAFSSSVADGVDDTLVQPSDWNANHSVDLSDIDTDSLQLAEVADAPGTPDSGFGKLYVKSDGKLYFKNDAGTETEVTNVVYMTNPMTTAGDIIYGGASGTPTRLAAGTEGYILTMGATNPAWAAAAAGSTDILMVQVFS